MKLNKEDLITAVCDDTGFRRSVVEITLDSVINNITIAMSNGKEVQIHGFGTFEPRKRAPRTGRNISMGEPVKIPGRIVPYFNAGKALRNAVCKDKE